MQSHPLCRTHLSCRHNLTCSPLRFIVVFWSGSLPIPSWHMTRVPLSATVTVTVAVDVINLVITCTMVIWKGGSEITRPSLLGRSARVIPRDGTLHWCAREGTVHVKVTVSPGHGLSTLVCNWALEAEKNTLSNVVSVTEVVSHQYSKLT